MAVRSERGDTAAIDALDARRRAAARLRGRVLIQRRGVAVSRHLLLIAVAIPFLVPFYWLVISAFKTNSDLTSLPPTMWPHPWTFADMQNAVGV